MNEEILIRIMKLKKLRRLGRLVANQCLESAFSQNISESIKQTMLEKLYF